MIKYLTPIFTLFLFSCTSSGTKTTKDSTRINTDTIAKTSETQRIIANGEGYIVEKTIREGIILYGAKFTCAMEDVYEKAKAVFPTINAQISNHGGVISGPLTVVYLAEFTPGKMVTAMAGVPVKKIFSQSETGEFLKIPTRQYFKMACTAGMGETANWHTKMTEILKEKQLTFTTPILEIFTESRNGNMEMISKASLLYPLK